MSLDQEYERVVGWFARRHGGADQTRDETATSETMIASAEYELAQLRRDLDEVRLAPLQLNKVA